MQETVAHYRLRERLGSGAMGEVWLAEDTRLHRLVALKMLLRKEADDAAALARVEREARIASSLSHPNVAVVYDAGETEFDGRPAGYVAMEYVKGRTLAEVLKDGRLDAASILPIARQIAEALDDAHERGVVHRDIKPSNVMLTERGLVKVLDFGLARFVPSEHGDLATWSRHRSLDGAIVGTLAYMSPEQARGRVVDARSDVFSLGVVLYELLAGNRPFAGRNAIELIEATLTSDPPPPSADGPLAAGLSQVVSRMLEKDPERRHQSMSEVLRDLEGLLAGQAPAPAPGRELAVAVMAFTNVTGRLDDAWLGTGLAETVAAGLSAVGGLSVVSRERIVEVLRGLGLEPDASDLALAARVGRETGARVVVSGSYQCLAERIRATARVVETATDRVTFSTQIDGTREGIFDVQDRLVADLVAGFRAHVSPARPGETLVLEAYEAFSKGLLNFRDESQESIDRAIVYFERAAAGDPAYARAHMMLGAALDLKADYLTTPELSERALVSLDRALALGADPAEVWRYRGSALLTLGRDGEAIDAYERALALNPMDASSQSGIGRVHFILRGDFAKAAVAYERALAINPRAGWSAMQLAHCATFLREFSRAEAAARLAVTLQRTFLSGRTGMVIIGAHMRLGHVFARQNRHREALEQYGLELEFVDAVGHALRGRIVIELQQRIGESKIRLGEEAEGRAALDLAVEACRRRMRTGADDPMSPYYGACACALLGDTEEALALLELAAAKRPQLTAARAAVEPALEALRLEPRFRATVGPLASADDR